MGYFNLRHLGPTPTTPTPAPAEEAKNTPQGTQEASADAAEPLLGPEAKAPDKDLKHFNPNNEYVQQIQSAEVRNAGPLAALVTLLAKFYLFNPDGGNAILGGFYGKLDTFKNQNFNQEEVGHVKKGVLLPKEVREELAKVIPEEIDVERGAVYYALDSLFPPESGSASALRFEDKNTTTDHLAAKFRHTKNDKDEPYYDSLDTADISSIGQPGDIVFFTFGKREHKMAELGILSAFMNFDTKVPRFQIVGFINEQGELEFYNALEDKVERVKMGSPEFKKLNILISGGFRARESLRSDQREPAKPESQKQYEIAEKKLKDEQNALEALRKKIKDLQTKIDAENKNFTRYNELEREINAVSQPLSQSEQIVHDLKIAEYRALAQSASQRGKALAALRTEFEGAQRELSKVEENFEPTKKAYDEARATYNAYLISQDREIVRSILEQAP